MGIKDRVNGSLPPWLGKLIGGAILLLLSTLLVCAQRQVDDVKKQVEKNTDSISTINQQMATVAAQQKQAAHSDVIQHDKLNWLLRQAGASELEIMKIESRPDTAIDSTYQQDTTAHGDTTGL